MDDTGYRRREPYVWPSWLTGLMAGDKHCVWAAWFRAHHGKYAKRPDPNANQLTVWKAEHAALVQERAYDLSVEGWETVSVEDQNKFVVHGKAATIGGVADLLAIRGDVALVEDCKTGQRRESDFWQVVMYILLLPMSRVDLLKGKCLSGAVVYGGGRGRRTVSAEDAVRAKDVVWSWVKNVSADDEPPRTPSWSECRFCDLACCPDRVVDEPGAAAETEEF